MNRNLHTELSNFFVVGINYKKTDTGIRGSFAIGPEQYELFLSWRPSMKCGISLFCLPVTVQKFMVLPNILPIWLIFFARRRRAQQNFLMNCLTGKTDWSRQHLFDVGAGLDSQILGDYEIVGQLRKAMKFAKERGFIHTFLERTLNQVLQSSKEIKNNTALSDGTVSVAFAAVQYIREHIVVG